mmetsp:Transcript_77241/g.198856  ORF Transcript_77241/g.198856 Transcript_77241/m.198856 type:complete len:186 (+) Transcript_77241:122-679(+)
MSSWQQAIAEDLRNKEFKGRKRDTTVVLSGNQQKNIRTGRDTNDVDMWTCSQCNEKMPGGYRRCDKCGVLRDDERRDRLEMRAKDGELGRGGGFFQRSDASDKKEWHSDDEEYDEFGRKKRKGSAAKKAPAVASEPAADASAAQAEGPGGSSAKEAKMSERQRAALARLRQRAAGGAGRRSRSRS